MCENNQSVLYLFTQPFDGSMNLVKGIFEHLHEDVLLDWAEDYLEMHHVSFFGDLIKIVAGFTIVRNLTFPLYMKNAVPTTEGKILKFFTRDEFKKRLKK